MSQNMDTTYQCCSCEQTFFESYLVDGGCPHCFSGNWVRGYIDETESQDE